MRNAETVLWGSWGQIQLLDYHYFAALTLTAVGPPASREREHWRKQLGVHLDQLQQWADQLPQTYLDKAALVSAEIARVEGRDLEAMHLYETAIRAAQESGSARHEAIANELAAGFYLQHAVARAGRACLEQARDSYLRWGALAKAKHLDATIEALRARAPRPGSEPSLLDRLDLSSVVKATTAISTGLAPENLFETLMRILVEHAGADRGVLLVERAGGSQAAVALENARLYAELEEENRERRKAEEELRESECRWRNLFATAAVSLWQLDFSDVEQRLDHLRSQGVLDFGSYFAGHPEFAREAVSLVKIIDVNSATLELLGARSKEELEPDAILLPETVATCGEQIVALAERRTPFNAETALRKIGRASCRERV